METVTFPGQDRSPTENWDNGINQEESAFRIPSKTQWSLKDKLMLFNEAVNARHGLMTW
jgi:hypothetical protein